MAYLFDEATDVDVPDVEESEPVEEPGHLFDGEPFSRPQDLLYGDKVIVVPRHVRRSAHGVSYVEDGAFWCWCSVEGREQQAGMFSISGAEDKNPQTAGGLREVTVQQVLAREWHADIHALVWALGDLYDVDGAPEWRRHGKTHHWEVRLRRIADWSQVPEALRPKPPVPDPDAPVWGEGDADAWHESDLSKT